MIPNSSNGVVSNKKVHTFDVSISPKEFSNGCGFLKSDVMDYKEGLDGNR
jgi:hypothetical protein